MNNEMMLLTSQVASKRKQLSEMMDRRCGNCSRWMKSTCKPEKERGQFKSINSFACQDFSQVEHTFAGEIEAEIVDLEKKILEATNA